MSKSEEYSTQVIKVGNVTVYLHRPILTEKEKAKRTEAIVTALGNFGKAMIKN
jgi:hypothetical protein